MKDKIIDAIINLLKIKSIMSLVAVSMFIFLVVNNIINGEQALTIITMVFTAYFVHSANKNNDTKEGDTKNDNTN